MRLRPRNVWLLVGAAILVALLVDVFLLPAKLDGPAPAPSPVVVPSGSGAGRATAGGAASPATGSSGTAGATPAPVAAAETLRRSIRTDPAALARLRRELLDPATPAERRAFLAAVLGTADLPETDPTLLGVLRQEPDSAALVRAVLLALGATRDPPDDDEVFDLGDRPWGEDVAGLGITVHREVEDPEVRHEVAARLSASDPDVREAAAAALRHSLAFPETRDRFVQRLAKEPADEVAAVLAEAAAGYARATAADERTFLLDRVLAAAARPELEGTRFRLENDLKGVALTPSEISVLAGLAGPSQPFGTRSFGLIVLTGSATASGAEAVATARRELLAALADPDAALRDLAARRTAEIEPGDEIVEKLVAGATTDPAWNVRYSALEAVVPRLSGDEARRLLERAAADPDSRVVDRAAELAKELRGRDR